MQPRDAARRLALLVDLRRELLRYGQRHVLYRTRSWRDSTWLDVPQVVRASDAAGGFSLEVVPRDEIGRFLYLYGVWDLLSTRLLQSFLRPGMTVLDVGANIGYFSVLAASKVGRAGVVCSFEPHDEIRELLARNVERNRLSNVVVRAEAVTSAAGEIPFYRSADASNQGISSTVAGAPLDAERREEQPRLVPAVRLDDVAGELGRPVDLVKVDVEGAERAAFEGGDRLLSAADAPLVVFEAYDLEPTAALLEAYGYSIRRLAHDLRRGIRLERDGGALSGEPNYVACKAHHQPVLAGLV